MGSACVWTLSVYSLSKGKTDFSSAFFGKGEYVLGFHRFRTTEFIIVSKKDLGCDWDSDGV